MNNSVVITPLSSTGVCYIWRKLFEILYGGDFEEILLEKTF